jgi:hypothetical protein
VKRLARHVVVVCAAASLLLCVALCVLWARSYNVAYYIRRSDVDAASRDRRDVSVVFATGRALFYVNHTPGLTYEDWADASPGAGEWRMSHDSYWYATRNDMGIRFADARWAPQPGPLTAFGRPGSFGVGVNLLIPIALSAVLPITWRVRVLLARRRRRISKEFPHGRCARCGYDLRASPGRCPECGTLAKESTLAETQRAGQVGASPAARAEVARPINENSGI